ncbi:hypothetical protein B7494_g5963 [Chlorociboria aeruginascens]|nr:hypothetical protein B7494_g5963 [Chlorociboria aeruginascens]
MSAFSRGCLFRHQLSFNPSRATPRFFSSTIFLRAAKQVRSSSLTKQASSKSAVISLQNSSPRALPIYQSYAKTLAQKAHPTPLYQAPSHALLIFSSYSAAAFCLAWVGYNAWAVFLNPPPNLPAWAPYAYGGICVFMGAFAGWIMLGPYRIVKTITAFPANAKQLVGVKNKPIGRGGLIVEIELTKMHPLPFLKAKKLYAQPEEIYLLTPIVPPEVKRLGGRELMRIREEEEREKQRVLEYERSHIMTRPFRDMSRAFSQFTHSIFVATRKMWTGVGFVKIKVKGKGGYKIDITDGWALDGGRGLERLVGVKPR